LAVGLFKVSRCDGEVFLGGGEGGVAEEFADGFYVGAFTEEVGGEAMA
jgi:hypothetical protein